MLSPESLALLDRLMVARPTSEWCGYLAEAADGRQRLLALRNLGRGGEFVVDSTDRARVLAAASVACLTPLAFVHTHLLGLEMSAADAALFAADNLPWIIAMRINGDIRVRAYPRQPRPIPR